MKTATIVGYHGRKNFGDDIFRDIIFHWASKELGVSRFYITAGEDSVKSCVADIEISTFSSPIKRVSRLLWPVIFIKSLKSDYLIFAAGSIFTILPFMLLFTVVWLLKKIRGNSLKVIAVGVSIGPFKSNFDRYWCFKTLKLMDWINLRDKKSKQALDAALINENVNLSYDLALCWTKLFSLPTATRCPGLIGLSITSRGFGECDGGLHSYLCNTIVDALTSAMTLHPTARIRILCVCSDEIDGDTSLSLHILDRLVEFKGRVEVVEYDGVDISAFHALLCECSIMIASRMHAGVMAMIASVPLFHISYAEKITNFFNHCELPGDYLVDHDRVTSSALKEFIQLANSGKLTEFSLTKAKLLSIKGDIVYNNLLKIDETISGE